MLFATAGNLCAGCLPGYGQTGEATCSKCPPKSLNSLYYVLVSLINVVMIMITIRAQLVRSEGDSGSQSKTARELREGERSGRVDSPGSGKPHGLLQRLSLWRHTAKKEEEKKLPNASMDESGGGERVDSAMMGAPAARARALASASKVAVRPESSSSKRNQQEEQQQQQQRQEGKQGRGAGGSKEGLEDGDDNEAVGDAELNQGTHSIVIKVDSVSVLLLDAMAARSLLAPTTPVRRHRHQRTVEYFTVVYASSAVPHTAGQSDKTSPCLSASMHWLYLADACARALPYAVHLRSWCRTCKWRPSSRTWRWCGRRRWPGCSAWATRWVWEKGLPWWGPGEGTPLVRSSSGP